MEHKFAETEINGRKYELIKFGALKSVGLATKLGKVLAPMLSGGDDTEAASILIGNLDDDFIQKTITDLTSTVTCGGMSIDFDEHFAKHQEDLLPVVAFSLKENVLGFFTANALRSLTSLV